MKVAFCQVYIAPGVRFPCSVAFQRYLSEQVTQLVEPSPRFLAKYGPDFIVVFNVSAKRGISENEIKGPSVFRKTGDVEYSVFLPFDVIHETGDPIRAAIEHLLGGVAVVLGRLEIDTTKLAPQREAIARVVCADPAMLDP